MNIIKVTLIGTRLAKVGIEFVFNGPTSECEGCRLKNTCMNLDIGRRYQVVSTRDTHHECPLHDGGVYVVEVTETPTIVTIESRKALEGSKISFNPPRCDKNTCSIYDLCHPLWLRPGDKCTIHSVLGEPPENCANGLALRLVELKRE
ncbi:MAG: UPF0179 family protein [Methanocellales archaeon]|nr:UPF0179 family protein [Methanocellales archaeon]MDD3291350.1 UPF0179 family protein [Methanocellales archaeon]MDD5234760.1 UPF0179 family protein [Methanocellales archaeon]MDD5484889.1 UPF0179 family protein [Methanocellales archaeon]